MTCAEPKLKNLKALLLQWLIGTDQKQNALAGKQCLNLAHCMPVAIYLKEILSLHEVPIVAAPNVDSNDYLCRLSALLH